MKKRLDRPGVGTCTSEHDPVGWMFPIDGKELPGNCLIVPLLFLPDTVVVGVLAPAGAVLIAAKPLTPGTVGAQAGQLAGVVGGDLEEPSAGPVEHDSQKPTELVFHRGQLAHQRARVDREAGSID